MKVFFGASCPGSAEGQFLIGVDVEMGAAMGEETEEELKGDSEDGKF